MTALRRVATGVRRRSTRADLMSTAAAMTTYAVIGLVPLLLLGLRISAALFGADGVRGAGERIADYVPGPLGIDVAVRAVATGAVGASWWAVAAAVLPA